MLRASSEIAVAISVASGDEKPVTATIARAAAQRRYRRRTRWAASCPFRSAGSSCERPRHPTFLLSFSRSARQDSRRADSPLGPETGQELQRQTFTVGSGSTQSAIRIRRSRVETGRIVRPSPPIAAGTPFAPGSASHQRGGFLNRQGRRRQARPQRTSPLELTTGAAD